MRKILCVSYPRSGHHLLVRTLKAYFGGSFHFCGYYEHCRTIPCSDPLTNYQKNHDHELELPIQPDQPHIVQHRHPIPAIISWFELALRRGWKHEVKDDTQACWDDFLKEKTDYWKGFVRKWDLDNNHPDTLVVPYQDMTDQPTDWVSQVIHFMAPDLKIDQKLLATAIEAQGVARSRKPAEFRYFNKRQIEQAEKSVVTEMQALGLKSALEIVAPV